MARVKKCCVLCWVVFTGLFVNGQVVRRMDTASLGNRIDSTVVSPVINRVDISADSLFRGYRYNTVDAPLTFSKSQLYLPAGLIVAGIATTGNGHESIKNELAEERNEHFSDFRTHVDNYLAYSPLVIAYGLDALGIPSKTDFNNRTAILIKGEFLMLGTVSLLKNTTHEVRPDGSSTRSFPSGHTAQAFAAATFLSEEYKGRYPWMPYAAYGLATGVGLLRMANNKHYICDVLVGAGLGILSMKIAYWTHLYRWGRKKRPVFRP